MKFISNVYLLDKKPHASVTAVDVEHGPLATFVRPVSKDDGWVHYKGKVHDTESDARIAAISEIDVLVAHLENLRATLVKKQFGVSE